MQTRVQISLIIVFIILLFSACYQGEKEEQVDIISIYKTSVIDSSIFLQGKLLNETAHSFDAKHFAFSTFKGLEITAFLNNSFDTIIVFDGKTILKIALPLKKEIPISSIYFHNYDSLFVFFDREFIAQNSTDSFYIYDFILINSKGKLIDKYSLDSLDYIYHGILDPMIYLKRDFVKNTRIMNGKMYLPFSIYQPSISNTSLTELNIRLLCEYDLHKHKYRMLDIKTPSEDIGKTFSSDLSCGTIDFQLLNDSIILYVFEYSSTIYQYNVLTDETKIKTDFPNFYFNNDTTISAREGFIARFYAPLFVDSKDLYIRKIKIKKYKNHEDFYITQVFDSSFLLLGYVYSDSVWTELNMNAKGKLIVSNKNEHYISYEVDIKKASKVLFSEIEASLTIKENTTSYQISSTKENNAPNYKERLLLYINSFKQDGEKKFILINTDINCSDCLDYIMKQFKTNSLPTEKQKIRIIFYGSNLKFSEQIMRNYEIKSFDFIYLDEDFSFTKYFKEYEYSITPLVTIGADSSEVIIYEPNNLIEKFNEFIKL